MIILSVDDQGNRSIFWNGKKVKTPWCKRLCLWWYWHETDFWVWLVITLLFADVIAVIIIMIVYA